jgi:CheY-specific phosphatase CheX
MLDLLAEFTSAAATSAFQVMAGRQLAACRADALALNGERCVTSSIRYSGHYSGALHLHAPLALAREISASMVPPNIAAEIPEELVADTIGEFTNMVVAKLQSRLNDRGVPCEITPPSVAWNDHFTPTAPTGPRSRLLPFQCGDDQIVIELSLD